MGFIKKLFGFDELRGDKDKPQPKTIQDAGTTAKTPEQIEKEKRQRAVAANAGQSTAFNPLGEDQNVTSKSLLGL